MPKRILPPQKCRYCNSKVELVTGDIIYASKPYAKSYANDFFYLCTSCRAYVGCHQNSKRPLGILANEEERELRKKCHKIFDNLWRQDLRRKNRYFYLAEQLGIAKHNSHIAYFDKKRITRAIQLMEEDIKSFRQKILEITKNEAKRMEVMKNEITARINNEVTNGLKEGLTQEQILNNINSNVLLR